MNGVKRANKNYQRKFSSGSYSHPHINSKKKATQARLENLLLKLVRVSRY